jgi:hypothetical protein
MVVFTNFNVGMLSDKTLIRDLAHVILAHDHFARDAWDDFSAMKVESILRLANCM